MSFKEIQIPPSHSTAEKEKKQKAFRVEVGNPDWLFAAIQEGRKGTLGEFKFSNDQSPEEPLHMLEVNLIVSGKNPTFFNIEGEFELNVPFSSNFYESNRKTVGEVVAKKFAETTDTKPNVRGGAYIIDTPHGTRFVLDHGTILDHFTIHTGMSKDSIQALYRLPPPQANRESFDPTIRGFIYVLEKTVEIVYGLDNKTPPNQELILRPPPSLHPDTGSLQI